MPSSPRALAKPALLQWARESARISKQEVVRRLGAARVTEDTITDWETPGGSSPSIAQLRKLGTIYRRPLVVFFLPEPPRDFDALEDYRRPADRADDSALSTELAYELRCAHERRESALELMGLLGEPAPQLDLTVKSDSPSRLAEHVRRRLGVSLPEQLGWSSKHEALSRWRTAIENLGILVFQLTGVPPEEASGFSIPLHPLPVVAINARESPSRRIFTLMHELCHLVSNQGGRCAPSWHEQGRTERARVEAFCNEFAGMLLVPKAALLEEDVVREHDSKSRWTDAELATLAKRFSVSEPVVLFQLRSERLVSARFFAARMKTYAASRYEPAKGGNAYRNKVARMGRSYIRLVFNALGEQLISPLEAAAYLRSKVSQFEELRQATFGGLPTG